MIPEGYEAFLRDLKTRIRDADQNVQQLVGQIPWGHNIVLIEKVKDPAKRQWYIEQTMRDVGKPIGVSEYRLTHTLPGDLAQALPAPGDLERLMQEEGSESHGG